MPAPAREERQRRTQAYREEQGFKGGVVVFYDNAICGWVNELRNPESWQPGCIAVDEEGNEWTAVGGNGYDGAKQWQPAQ